MSSKVFFYKEIVMRAHRFDSGRGVETMASEPLMVVSPIELVCHQKAVKNCTTLMPYSKPRLSGPTTVYLIFKVFGTIHYSPK